MREDNTDRQTDRQRATFIDMTQDLELTYDARDGTHHEYIRPSLLVSSRRIAKSNY